MTATKRNELLDAALEYAEHGLPVFPCKQRGKEPLTPHGFKDATTDVDQIQQWWSKWPDANIGLPTGSSSGVLVVDCDVRDNVDGRKTLIGWTKGNGGMPIGPYARTGGGGVHYLLRCPPGQRIKSRSIGAGIDLKATGGYVIVPPSVHPSGDLYEWRQRINGDLPEPPAWLLDRMIGNKPRPENPPPKQEIGTVDGGVDERDKQVALECLKHLSQERCDDGRDWMTVGFILHDLDPAPDGPMFRAWEEWSKRSPKYKPGEPARRWEAMDTTSVPDSVATVATLIDWATKDSDGEFDPRKIQPRGGSRPLILIATDEHRVIRETVNALRADPGIFQRGNMLVRVVRDVQPDDGVKRAAGTAIIQTMPAANLRERITAVANFTKLDKNGKPVAAHPAAWLVNAIDARGEWPGIPPLTGISDCPVIRADGTIHQTPGYDRRTGVLYDPAGATFPSLPDTLTIDDADAAWGKLEEVVADFPFETEEHKACWLAGLLTPLARFAFDGPAPLFLIDANIRGAGKGLLVHVIAHIVLGHDAPVSGFTKDTEELRKRFTAIAIAGDRIILLDNVVGKLGNDVLDRALTCTIWKDRVLGKSQEVQLPLNPAWFATSNNATVGADTLRRVLHVRLDCMTEKPEERDGFKHPHLLAWVRENRAELLTAALTILAAYLRAGRPPQALKPFGSFEGWSDTVRNAVVWLGLPDPYETRVKLAETADTVGDALAQLIDVWGDYNGDNAVQLGPMIKELYQQAQSEFVNTEVVDDAMRAAVENFVETEVGKMPSAQKLGTRLAHIRRRWVGGKCLDLVLAKGRKTGRTWQLLSQNTQEGGGR